MSWAGALTGFSVALILVAVGMILSTMDAAQRGRWGERETGKAAVAAFLFVIGATLLGAVQGG